MIDKEKRMQINIAKPWIGEAEKQAVLEVLLSGQLTQGVKVEAFEEAFAKYHGASYGIAMNNGTTALMAMMMAHEIKAGDEVIIPSFSFFATASAVLSVGAKPVFVDIDPVTYCLSPEAAEAAITSRTVAVMPVHLYGCPADMPRFQAICQQHGLLLLEDAAQAHGASIGTQAVGTWGNSSAFSFYPTKNMTTSEGGMVLTNDAVIASKLRMIRNQGMSQQYLHELVGYNFRMTNLAAAIGLVQLQQLTVWNTQRRENALHYNQHLHGVKPPVIPSGMTHVYHQYTIRVPSGVDRNEFVSNLNKRGVGARVYYPLPIHRQPVFERMGHYQDLDLPETEQAIHEVLSLPVYPSLSDIEREYVVQEVNKLC